VFAAGDFRPGRGAGIEKSTQPGNIVRPTFHPLRTFVVFLTNNFSRVFSSVIAYHSTSHMNGKRPAGGNILFLDCHVSWRNFPQMQIRTAPTLPTRFWF
jgi:prepilin-type processing-associated H-X9-DG protein